MSSELIMELSLSEILTIVGLLFTIIATVGSVYIILTNRITRLEVKQEGIQKDLAEANGKIKVVEQEREKDHRFLLEKLSGIESGQVETNVFLRENLKSITQIITSHANKIESLEKRNK